MKLLGYRFHENGAELADGQKMPYIHYEAFNKQKETRYTIKDVDDDRANVQKAKRGDMTHYTKSESALEKDPNRGDDWSIESSDEDHDDYRSRGPYLLTDYESQLIASYIAGKESRESPLHVRRSLDEFYYSSLKRSKIIARDQNQIVFKYKNQLDEEKRNKSWELKASRRADLMAREERREYFRENVSRRPINDLLLPLREGAEHEDQNLYEGEDSNPILMVDQLWMWIVDDGEGCLICTSGSVLLTLTAFRHSDYKFP